MIRDIDELLSRWGRWAIRSYTSSLGYPPYSPSCRGYRIPVTEETRRLDPGWQPADIHDCDTAVKLLDNPYRQIVVCHYVEHISMSAIARLMACHRNTIRNHMHEAHARIARELAEEKNLW